MKNGSRRSVSIWTALAGPLALMVVLVTALVSHITISRSLDSVLEMVSRLRGEINSTIVSHVRSFLEVPRCVTSSSAELLSLGHLPKDDQQALQRYFLHQVRQKTTITSIYFGNTSGGLADAGREGYGGALYYLKTEHFRTGPLHKYTVDEEGTFLETVFRSTGDFDARTRPWYTKAVEAGGPVASEPYVLATGQDMTVSLSVPVYDPSGTLLGVVSSDIFLSHIDSYLSSLNISPRGISFIIDEGGYLVASSLPEVPCFLAAGDTYRRLSADACSDLRIRQASRALGQEDRLPWTGETTIRIDDESWGMLVTSLHDYNGPGWRIVTLMPDSDFTQPVRDNLKAAIILILAALIGILALGAVVTRLLASPIQKLGDLAGELVEGRWVRAPSHHWIREVGKLYDAFNRFSEQFGAMVDSLNGEIGERKKAEEEVKALLSEKELLLEEVHHRIKNNMVTVRSLLALQAGTVEDPEARIVLQDAVNRVSVMSSAYEMLNKSGGYEEIPLRTLVKGVVRTLGGEARVTTDVDDFSLPSGMAINIGIIVNELLTNCMKYAGSGVSVLVRIRDNKKGIDIEVLDDGVGASEDVTVNKHYGTGLRIVEALVGQHNGTMILENAKGTAVKIWMEKI